VRDECLRGITRFRGSLLAGPRREGRDARAKAAHLIVQAPAGKLPRVLIDSKTGLAKNNLQAVCHRESGSRSLLVSSSLRSTIPVKACTCATG